MNIQDSLCDIDNHGDIDSICRDSVDIQYKIIQKKSQNLKNGKLIGLYNNVPFIFKCSHDEQHAQWCEKASRSTESESCQMANMFLSFFFSSSSSSDGLVQNCMTLSQSFSHKTAAFYTEQCTSPLLSHNFEFSWGGSNRSLLNYCFICNTIFLTFTHAHKSLSNKT